MYLGAYHFDGEPSRLLDGYDRLMSGFPPGSTDLHVCVERDRGITIYDACPSGAVFVQFSTSAGFAAAVVAAGLPQPRVEPLGDVHAVRVRESVAR